MAAAKRRKGTVGVIGLGIMGGAFAKNLAKAGWRVVGYDISAARRREAQRAGVEIAASVLAVAEKTPVMLTSLPKPRALMDTARTIAAAKLPRKTIVEMSTFAISDKEKARDVLAKAGHVMLDTPVSGTGAQARDARSRLLCQRRRPRDPPATAHVRGAGPPRSTTSAPSATAAR